MPDIHPASLTRALGNNFLGGAPPWYKLSIIAFLVLNPIIMAINPFVAGWLLIGEFIFTLAMALQCYPLPAGGLLALEAVIIGMAAPLSVYDEAKANFPVILLLIFMVAGIHFMTDFLQFTFTRVLVRVRSKVKISLIFCALGAFLSAFLDALTVAAVIIAVAYGFYNVYHRHISEAVEDSGHNLTDDRRLESVQRQELQQFRGFLRNIMMHGAVGTALGGVCTLVGEPQNLLIGEQMGWHFADFFLMMAPVSLPVVAVGLITCWQVEKRKIFGYGYELPGNIRSHLLETARRMEEKRGVRGRVRLMIQGLTGIWLILALALHLAEVGLIGLSVIVILTAFNGVIDEHRIGRAFLEALPFTALLVVFFTIVAVIHDQHLFAPIINYVLSKQGHAQFAAYYIANGVLSAISDNVFVATVYISETKVHMVTTLHGMVAGLGLNGGELMARLTDPHVARAEVLAELAQKSREVAAEVAALMRQFDHLAIAINAGTNIPSVATPNGQAAFLFLLTSALAPVIRLSYGRMCLLALPYFITMTISGLLAAFLFL
ncbi:MAG: sodium/proton antiporter NhaB [Desulfobulbaceae bacterium]|jgi:NhaB family Na+:H+ antiporter|nr:sodium/proton antiporter NhaB [Desulfobulbaceae bacterium]